MLLARPLRIFWDFLVFPWFSPISARCRALLGSPGSLGSLDSPGLPWYLLGCLGSPGFSWALLLAYFLKLLKEVQQGIYTINPL